MLGVLYAIGVLLVMGVSALVDGGQFAQNPMCGGGLTPEMVMTGFCTANGLSSLHPAAVAGVLARAGTGVLADVAPDQEPVLQPGGHLAQHAGLLAYGGLWLALSFLGRLGLMVLTALTGSATIASVGLLPLHLWIAAMFFCSLWFAFRDSFGQPTWKAAPHDQRLDHPSRRRGRLPALGRHAPDPDRAARAGWRAVPGQIHPPTGGLNTDWRARCSCTACSGGSAKVRR